MTEANEAVMAAACSLCKWPEEYKDSDDLWREKCDRCPALAAHEQQTEIGVYDTEEIHHGCTVQIWSNSMTGDVSVGWWKE